MATIEPNPQLAPTTKPPLVDSPAKRAGSVAWAIVVAMLGGVACGWCMSKYNDLGAPSLWALGCLAGVTARRLQLSGRFNAWALAIACLVAYGVAETCWLRWNTKNGEEGWWASICLWPLFLNEYTISALIGIVFAAFGAESAFRQTRRPSGSAAYTTRASG